MRKIFKVKKKKFKLYNNSVFLLFRKKKYKIKSYYEFSD